MNTLASFSNLFSGDMLIVLLIVLILFGAKKLPELARGAGQAIREFNKAKDEFEREITKSGEEVKIQPPQGSLPYNPAGYPQAGYPQNAANYPLPQNLPQNAAGYNPVPATPGVPNPATPVAQVPPPQAQAQAQAQPQVAQNPPVQPAQPGVPPSAIPPQA